MNAFFLVIHKSIVYILLQQEKEMPLTYKNVCSEFSDVDDTLYPFSSGIAEQCCMKIIGNFLIPTL